MSTDENGDGIIDVVERVPDYGAIPLTLDGDLSDGPAIQTNSLPNPVNQVGATTYMYSVSAEPVESSVDDVFGGYDLNREKRHIVLHGVDPAPDIAPVARRPAGLVHATGGLRRARSSRRLTAA